MGDLWSKISSNDRFWIGAQMLLFTASATAGLRQLRRGPRRQRQGALALGLPPIATAISIAEIARRDLGKNLTMAPTPTSDGHLVDAGIYGIVRHPMYLSATLGMLGWAAITRASAAIVAVPVAFAFFSAKASHEERLLSQRYAGYSDYRRRVPGRLVPRTRNSSRA